MGGGGVSNIQRCRNEERKELEPRINQPISDGVVHLAFIDNTQATSPIDNTVLCSFDSWCLIVSGVFNFNKKVVKVQNKNNW